MLLRPATVEDNRFVDLIVDGYDGAIKIDPERTKATLKELVASGGAFAAVHLGVVVGGVAGYLFQSGFSDDVIFIVMFLYLRPRRRRHTRWLLRQVEIAVKARGAGKVMYGIPTDGTRGQRLERFLRMQGYRSLEVHMVKDLGVKE